MTKIPKNLSDKDMLKDYHEAKRIEDVFLAHAEEKTPHSSRAREGKEQKISLSRENMSHLEELLLKLKLALYNEGIVDYRLKMELKDNKIIISPVKIDRH